MAGNFSVSYVIKARDQFTAIAEKVARSLQSIQDKVGATNAKMLGFAQSMDKIGKSLFLKVTVPILGLGGYAVKSAAQIERLGVAFNVMTGSADMSKKVMGDLLALAKQAPFLFGELGNSAKILLSTRKFTPENVVDQVRQLGDIASIYNVPLENLTSAFTQVINQDRVLGENIRQLQSSYGIPIVQELQELIQERRGIKYTSAQILKFASQGQITADALKKVFERLTSKNGTAFEGMKKTTDTISGAFTKFHDVMILTGANVGDVIAKTFNLTVNIQKLGDKLHHLSERFKIFAEAHPTITKMIVLAVTLAAALGPIAFVISGITKAIVVLRTAIIALKLVMILLQPELLAIYAVIALIVGAVMAMYKAVKWLSEHFKSAAGGFKDGYGSKFTGRFSGISGDSYAMKPLGAKDVVQTNNAKASMDININDKGGNVESVQSSQTGFMGWKLGKNNPPATFLFGT